jgi:hypothetical protein
LGNLPKKLSLLVYNPKAFITLIALISVLKLILCTIEPGSFDLTGIITLVQSQQTPIGPWIVLYPPLYAHTISNATVLTQWGLTPPPAMTPGLQAISISFRLPLFALDLATCVALFYAGKLMASPAMGRLAALIWFANPYAFFGTELLGVPDALATFLAVVSIALLLNKRFLLSAMFLGLGIWVKFFPFLFLPPILLFEHRSHVSIRDQVGTAGFGLLGLGGYLYWTIPSWQRYLTQYTPVAQPFPFIAGVLAVNSSAFVLILFYCVLLFFAKNTKSIISLLLPTLLVYYAASNPAPQYFIWVIPLMALDIAVVERSRAALLAVYWVLAFANWFFISSGFLTPSNYSLLMIPLAGNGLPTYSIAITQLLDNSAVISLLLPLVASVFFACVLAYVIDVSRSWFVLGKVAKNDGATQAVSQ